MNKQRALRILTSLADGRDPERTSSHAVDVTVFLKGLVKTDPGLKTKVAGRISGAAGMRARRAMDRKSKLSLSEVADLVARNHDRNSSKG